MVVQVLLILPHTTISKGMQKLFISKSRMIIQKPCNFYGQMEITKNFPYVSLLKKLIYRNIISYLFMGLN